ncbi:MAG: ABC transporter ATP-binding protein, partial [Chloroflexota bacterium]
FLLDLQTYCREELSRRLSIETRTMLFSEINRLDGIRYFETPTFYNRMDLASYGLALGPPQIIFKLSEFVQHTVTLLSFFGVLLILSPWLALLMIVATVPQLAGRLYITHINFKTAATNKPKLRRRDYLSRTLSRPSDIKDVRAYNLSEHLFGEFLQTSHEIHDLQRETAGQRLRIKSVLDILVGAVASSTFAVVIWQALDRIISVGDVTFYFSALVNVQNSLNNISDNVSALNAYTLYFDKYKEMQALPNDLHESAQPKRVPTLERGITLKDVSFAYQEDLHPALNNVSLTIPAGKTFAIVGENGSGKTTLVKLLTRLYDPDDGQIMWDDIDLREFTPEALRDHIAPVFQDFARYQLTLRENIGLGDVRRGDDRRAIEEAAHDAGLYDLIEKLPRGFDTILSHTILDDGSDGMDVSGGEWQKIALARVHLRNADFIVLDEPTADLDPVAERAIYEQFLAQKGERTALIISGRFSTVRMADTIAVMKNGTIAEVGTHAELLAKNGEYARLYRMQAEQYQ